MLLFIEKLVFGMESSSHRNSRHVCAKEVVKNSSFFLSINISLNFLVPDFRHYKCQLSINSSLTFKDIPGRQEIGEENIYLEKKKIILSYIGVG